MRLRTTQNQRAAFTLVEMMVAMTLTVFILVILSQAFGTGMETFRTLKAIGDMQENLRVAAMRIRADLTYDHFEGRRRLADPNFWGSIQPINNPVNGFFYIKQGTPSVSEGTDLDSVPCYRANDHVLWFSVKLRGADQQDFLSANVPAFFANLAPTTSMVSSYTPDNQWQQGTSTYKSQWGEVAYYLSRSGSTVELNNPASAAGTPLFTLYRAQRVVVPYNSNLFGKVTYSPANLSTYKDMSCELDTTDKPGHLYFNSPMDLAQPFPPPKNAQLGRAITIGNDLAQAPLLTNVVSFQVQVMWGNTYVFSDLSTTGNNHVFDTASSPPLTGGSTTNPPTISAVQITVRIWDVKTEQSRQITIIQDL